MNKYLEKNERVPKFEESYQEDHLEGPYNKYLSAAAFIPSNLGSL